MRTLSAPPTVEWVPEAALQNSRRAVTALFATQPIAVVRVETIRKWIEAQSCSQPEHMDFKVDLLDELDDALCPLEHDERKAQS